MNTGYFYGCGGRTRTYDLRVMSPTSYQLLYSAIFGSHSLSACILYHQGASLSRPILCHHPSVGVRRCRTIMPTTQQYEILYRLSGTVISAGRPIYTCCPEYRYLQNFTLFKKVAFSINTPQKPIDLYLFVY